MLCLELHFTYVDQTDLQMILVSNNYFATCYPQIGNTGKCIVVLL